MKNTIIFAHPWHGSFNKAIMDVVVNKLKNSEEYEIIDLNKEKFNPVMSEEELRLFSKGKYLDEKVGKYQDMIMNSDRLIFIFPIWWGLMPAILKGFFEKVFLKNWAYTQESMMLDGKLTHIKEAVVITTMQTPNIFYKLFMFSPIKNGFIKNSIKTVGVKKTKWFSCDLVHSNEKNRKKFLNKIENYFK